MIARAVCMTAALSALIACASKVPGRTAIPAPTSTAVHAEVRDSSVDALPDSRVPTSPDLVFAFVDVDGPDVMFRFRYRAGTFDPATTRMAIDLDIDQNAASGAAGVDYQIFIFPAGGRGADVAQTRGDSYTVVGTVAVRFVEDGCDVAVPRALLANEEGRFDFRVRVYAQQALPMVIDALPDVGFSRVQ